MPSSYTANNGIEKPNPGEQTGVWGATLNTNFDIIDRVLSGVGSISLSGTTHTLTTTDGTLTDGMYKVLLFTGALGANNTVTISPNDQDKLYFVVNATTDSGSSGPYSVIIKQGTGATVTVANGAFNMIYADGAGSGAAVTSLLANDVVFGDDVSLQSDGAVLNFGADDDVTLTHVADTGLLLNSTMQLQFNDASQYINAPSATVLDINATDEIELNATLADINANLEVSGTYTGGGLMTTGGNIVIPDAGNIGSASDTDAMAISSGGAVTFSQNPVFPAGGISINALDIDGGTDIGAAIVDADLFIVDDGAGGANRKVEASRIKAYTNAGVSSAADDITTGDSAVNIATTSGNITIDAQGDDTDIILKGTDGGADTTFLTIDGSAAGEATFNAGIVIADAGNIGSASDKDAIAISSGGVVTFSQAPVFPDGSIAIADLDIDGGTDIGEALVDADLFVVDNGAGGTNRKSEVSRIKTYVGAAAGAFPIANLDIDGGTDVGADLVDADLIIIDDGAGGTNRKAALSRLKTYIGAADNTLTTFKYTATAGQTTFSGNDDASNSLSYSAGNLLVILNGSVLINGTDYTASNGTSVVLTDAASVGDEVIIHAFSNFNLSTQTLTLFKYSATAGQTTFSGSDSASQTLAYTAGMIIVTLNGTVLDTSDYTASNGTSVVLDSDAAATVDDELNIIAFAPFNVSNVTTASADFAIGDDLSFTSDGAIINMGADSDVTMTHVHNKGVQFNTQPIIPTPTFRASKTDSNQTVTNAAYTKITFNTENWDIGGYYASDTYTPLVQGYYQVNVSLALASSNDHHGGLVAIYHNGSMTRFNRLFLSGLTNDDFYLTSMKFNGMLYMDGVDDTLEVYYYSYSEDSGDGTIGADSRATYFEAFLVSRSG